MHQLRSNNSGFIVLMAVIVMGAVAVISSLVVLTLSANSSQASSTIEKSNQAKGLADACVEYALTVLRDNSTYGGNEIITFDTGSCSLLSVTFLDDTATIRASGTVGDAVRRVEATTRITITNEGETMITETELQSWQEVADF